MKLISVSVLLAVGFILGVFHGEKKVTRIKKAVRVHVKSVKNDMVKNIEEVYESQRSATKYCTKQYNKLVEESNREIKKLEDNLNACEDKLKRKEYGYDDNLHPESKDCQKETIKEEDDKVNLDDFENENY